MKSRFLAASLGVLAATGLGVSSALLLRGPQVATDLPQSSIALPERSSSSVQSSSKPARQPSETVEYILKEYNGRLAVFTGENTVPDYELDVYTRHLPEYDRKQLEEGIPVQGYEQLTALIEDYIS